MGNINQSGEHCQKQYRCVVRPILSKQPSRVSCTLAEPSARARTLWSSDGCDHEDFNVRQSDDFFQPLLLVNFVFDRNEAYTAKSCLRCTRKSVSEFNLRYLNSIPKRVTAEAGEQGRRPDQNSRSLAINNGRFVRAVYTGARTLAGGGHRPPNQAGRCLLDSACSLSLVIVLVQNNS